MHKSDFTLEGKKGLILGIANDHSIAYGCARAFKTLGADLALNYLNEKAEPYVKPIADELEADIFMPCDVQKEEEVEALFKGIEEKWGKLDFALHSIAFAPKEDLQGRLVDSSSSGFLMAMDISCHSFLRMAKHAEPLMKDGGSLFTMSYLGANRVVENYNLMGPVKAALESSVRYVADELGPKGIRVHAISPGPVMTRASSGISEFEEMFKQAEAKTPMGKLAEIDEIGMTVAFLATNAGRSITGETLYIDGGSNIVA